jgi:DNA polymerase III alpha subunit
MINALEDLISMVKDANKNQNEPVYYIPLSEEIPDDEKAQNEYAKLGFFVSFHPLDNYKIKLSSLPSIQDLENKISGETVVLGGLVMEAQEKTTKKGTKMAVFTLEDLTGRLEVVVFGKAFNDFKPYLNMKNPAVQITGKLVIEERELDDGEVSKTPKILLSQIKLLEESEKIYKIVINLTKQDNLEELKTIITENPGEILLDLEYEAVVFHTNYKILQDSNLLKVLGKSYHYETFYQKKEDANDSVQRSNKSLQS